MIRAYMWLHSAFIHFQVLSQRADWFVSPKQAEMLFKFGMPVLGPNGVNSMARNQSPEVDMVIDFLC